MALTTDTLANPDFREHLAEAAYMRERQEELAVEREQETSDDFEYYVLEWGCVSDFGKRPYRTAVAETCDRLAELVAA